jgi:hypothetical protein
MKYNVYISLTEEEEHALSQHLLDGMEITDEFIETMCHNLLIRTINKLMVSDLGEAISGVYDLSEEGAIE